MVKATFDLGKSIRQSGSLALGGALAIALPARVRGRLHCPYCPARKSGSMICEQLSGLPRGQVMAKQPKDLNRAIWQAVWLSVLGAVSFVPALQADALSSLVRDRAAAKSDEVPVLFVVSVWVPLLIFATLLIINLSALILKPIWRLLHCLVLIAIWGLLLYRTFGTLPIEGAPLFPDERALQSVATPIGQIPIALGLGLVFWNWRIEREDRVPGA